MGLVLRFWSHVRTGKRAGVEGGEGPALALFAHGILYPWWGLAGRSCVWHCVLADRITGSAKPVNICACCVCRACVYSIV